MTDQPATLAAALVQLQARLPRITKDDKAEVETKTGGKYSYTYANLASIHDAVFPLMAECGLAWTCRPTLTDGQFVLRYMLHHAGSEDFLQGDYPLPTTGTPQAIGSAITYARRYCLTAVLGIAPAEDDDDAQAAKDVPVNWQPPANPRTRKADRHNAARSGPLPDDQWTAAPADEDTPGSITAAQRARLMAAFNRAGITDRTDRLAAAMSILDLPELATSNDLSMRQAGQLITSLEAQETS